VYQHEIDERAKALKLWVRRKAGNRKLICSRCGQRVSEIHEVYEREIRDLACFEFGTTVVIELHRIRCPECGIRTERVEQLPSKAPFSKRFEEMVGQACESASARQVARRFSLAESTVRALDLRYLERWTAARRKPALRQMGVDEIHLGKQGSDGLHPKLICGGVRSAPFSEAYNSSRCAQLVGRLCCNL
jgi:transposase